MGSKYSIVFTGLPVKDVYGIDGELLFPADAPVKGNLVVSGEDWWLVGGVVEHTEEYIALEWWVKVKPETVEFEVTMNDVPK